MAKMTLRKANADRKLTAEKINSIRDNIVNEKTLGPISFYKVGDPFIGSLSPSEAEDLIKAEWQRLEDLIKYYNKLNVAVLHANATTLVKVPKFKGLTEYDKADTEDINIAAAINRKNYYKEVLYPMITSFGNKTRSKINAYHHTKEVLDGRMEDKIRAQFGPDSTQSSKARIEYEEHIRTKFETRLIDPLKIEDRLNKAAEMINDYVAEIDSLLSHATETTEIEVED